MSSRYARHQVTIYDTHFHLWHRCIYTVQCENRFTRKPSIFLVFFLIKSLRHCTYATHSLNILWRNEKKCYDYDVLFLLLIPTLGNKFNVNYKPCSTFMRFFGFCHLWKHKKITNNCVMYINKRNKWWLYNTSK